MTPTPSSGELEDASVGGLPALRSETFVADELPGGADVLEVAIGLDAGASLDTTEQEVATLVAEQIVLGLTDR